MYSWLRHAGSILWKRQPIQLTFFVTRKCNARCPFCFYLRSAEGTSAAERRRPPGEPMDGRGRALSGTGAEMAEGRATQGAVAEMRRSGQSTAAVESDTNELSLEEIRKL